MDLIFNIITTLAIAITGLTYAEVSPVQTDPDSVEIGLLELSPAGEQGGYAVPASGGSTGCTPTNIFGLGSGACTHPPTITIDPPIVRPGEPVTVTLDPGGNTGCELIGDIPGAGPITTEAVVTVTAVSDTTIIIECDGVDVTDRATIRVLPRIQET